MPDLTTQWICLGENPEVLLATESSLPDNSIYPLAAPSNPPPGLGSAGDSNHFYQFAFWNVNGNLIFGETVLIPVGTQPITATAWYRLQSTIPGYSYACSVPWFSLGRDRPFVNDDSEGWQSPIETVDGQAWNEDEPVVDTDDGAHDIVLKQFIGNELFQSVLVMSGSASVNGRNIHVNQNAKNVAALVFYEPFAQAQFQNLKQVLAKIRLPWKELETPTRRDVSRLSSLIKLAQRPGPLPPTLLRDLSASLKRIKVNDLKKRMSAIEETLFLIEAARILSDRALQFSRSK
jgi:hypothetical protein